MMNDIVITVQNTEYVKGIKPEPIIGNPGTVIIFNPFEQSINIGMNIVNTGLYVDGKDITLDGKILISDHCFGRFQIGNSGYVNIIVHSEKFKILKRGDKLAFVSVYKKQNEEIKII